MDNKWKSFIEEEMKKEYMISLKEFISKRRQETIVLPDSSYLFNAFNVCHFNNIKVIIIGADPYPSSSDAHGLAFSTPSEHRPYSLQNIFDEVLKDFFNGNTGGINVFQTNNLTQWCTQGVLLLNSVLTTEEGKPGAHSNKGWEIFTENIIKFICANHQSKLVWMLWGKQAKSFKKHIMEKHLILESEHPASVRHNHEAWFGNRHFTKANEFIRKTYFNIKMPINWGTYTHHNYLTYANPPKQNSK